VTTFALIGAGQASAVAARTLRRRGFDGDIVLIGDEPDRPYQRPPLSKEFLAEGDDDGLFLLPEKWCADQRVELRLGVTAQRIASGGVELDDGSVMAADAVLIATGGRPRRLRGVEGERIFYLRTLRDAERLRKHLQPGVRVVVIGAGFIGSEVASSARARGCDVTLLEALDTPLQRVLGPDMGAACAAIHTGNGVDLRCGQSVVSVVEQHDGVVVTTSGGPVEADLVVVGVGITPNVQIAETSGIACNNGILVDEYCRTSLPHVYAAGDVANHSHPLFGERIRVEHFDNASRQGAAAANCMLGRDRPYDDPHWFWSDQYDVNLQYAGHATTWDKIVVRGAVDELDFSAFYLRDRRVRAIFAVDRGGDIILGKELITQQVKVDPQLLADDDCDLAELLPEEEA
jgi:3-phenylpropionate/trans-cinnamate dioxygenase ferredoxin reductase subunit